jgi:hypothetical protein
VNVDLSKHKRDQRHIHLNQQTSILRKAAPENTRGEGWDSRRRHSPPLPLWERASRRELARDAFQRRMRKSHGGKGEGSRIEAFAPPGDPG